MTLSLRLRRRRRGRRPHRGPRPGSVDPAPALVDTRGSAKALIPVCTATMPTKDWNSATTVSRSPSLSKSPVAIVRTPCVAIDLLEGPERATPLIPEPRDPVVVVAGAEDSRSPSPSRSAACTPQARRPRGSGPARARRGRCPGSRATRPSSRRRSRDDVEVPVPAEAGGMDPARPGGLGRDHLHRTEACGAIAGQTRRPCRPTPGRRGRRPRHSPRRARPRRHPRFAMTSTANCPPPRFSSQQNSSSSEPVQRTSRSPSPSRSPQSTPRILRECEDLLGAEGGAEVSATPPAGRTSSWRPRRGPHLRRGPRRRSRSLRRPRS